MRSDRRRWGVRFSFLLAVLAPVSSTWGQGTKADYERADRVFRLTQNTVFKMAVTPHWSSDGNRFWYRNSLPQGASEAVLVDAVKGTRALAFDHAKMASALEKATKKPRKADHLDIDRLHFGDDGVLVVVANEKAFKIDPKDESLTALDKVPPEPSAAARVQAGRRGGFRRRADSPRGATSPDGKFTVTARDHNLWLKENGSDKDVALTTDGKATDFYEGGVYWSPDSSHFVALRHLKGDERKVYLIESSPKDQLQPKLHNYDYLKPGDRVEIRKPRLFNVATKKEVPVTDDLFANPWSTEEFHWSPDSSYFSFLFNQRGHQALRIVAFDKSGKTRAIANDETSTFVDYSNKTFTHYLDKTNELIWMSERSGWNHLYLIDTKTGAVKNPITKGDWLVLGVERVDDEKRQIWFRAGAIHPEQDPYYVHYARVNFDGSGLTLLTEGDGTHQIDYSPDRRFFIDTYSRVDMPPVIELRRESDGKKIVDLERADASRLAASGVRQPERFKAKGRDGKTDIYGVIYRPTNYDAAKKYPVIEHIYAGPHGAFVPKRFSPFHGQPQAITELGFIVVQIDGMGTNWRSRAFHDVAAKNVGDAGFPDRILWMRAAAAQDPSMDITRVGIYGGSAGGQNAMGAMLFHPEFYKAAAADCGCHDNRMDKIWWNEAWMGWPVGPHYAEQSNVTNAHKLQGKLLLFVGELDRNVDPASTMQVVNALIKADKDFELVVIPGGGHGAGGGRYGQRRQRDFFVRSLLGVEPRR